MAEEFKAITTQEEFDNAIKSRLERERETVKKSFADYDDLKRQVTELTTGKSALEKTIQENAEKQKSLQAQLDEAVKKVKGFEIDAMKTSVAIEKGLPLELRTRLSGETEEEIRKDADSLAKIFSQENRKNLPGFEKGDQHNGTGEDEKTAALKGMLKDLKLKE